MTVTGLVYPNIDPNERDDSALTERQRRRKAARSGGAPGGIDLWEHRNGRAKKKADAYERLGIQQTNAVHAPSLSSGLPSVARRLDHLGGDALSLNTGAGTLESLAELLAPDFIVSANTTLITPESSGFTQATFDNGPQQAAEPLSFGERYEASGVKAAHAKRFKGATVVCAVLDTGADADHADFSHRRKDIDTHIDFGFVLSDDWARPPAEGRAFDLFGHGTHVCSMIGGRKGVAPNAKLICAAAPQTRLTSNTVMFGIGLDWLLAKAEAEQEFNRRIVLNLSLGFPNANDPDAPSDEAYISALATFNGILDVMIDIDVLVVAAVGNRANRFLSPGDRPDVLSVGSVAGDLQLSPFSGHVPQLERPAKIGPRVMGYGQAVVAADRRLATGDHLWVRRSGTSQAAAYVTGIAALYWSKRPKMSALELAGLVEASALPLDHGIRTGAGLARFDPKA